MEITLKIERKGNEIGTIGWLAQHAAKIKIGVTQANKQAAWLLDDQGKTITCLAVRDYYGDPDYPDAISLVSRGRELCPEVSLTDAAFEAVRNIAEQIAPMLNEPAGEQQIDVAFDDTDMRTENIRLRVTKDEKQAIQSSAEDSGQTISQYIRSRVL